MDEMQNDNRDHVALSPALKGVLAEHCPTGKVAVSRDPVRPFLSFAGTSIYDPTDPLGSVAEEVAAMEPDPSYDLVVLFGYGLGLHAAAIQQKYNAPIIVLEPSLDLLEAGLSFPAPAVPNLTIVHKPSELLAAIEEQAYLTDRHMLAGVVPAYATLFPEAFERFKLTFKAAADTMNVRDNTLALRGDIWSQYAIENLPRFGPLKPLEILKERFAGVPGIIVGTGPSLDKNMSLLEAVKGEVLVIACNSAVKPLVRAGIIPDMAAIIESNDQSGNFRDNPYLDRMVIAMTPDTHPNHFDLPFRHKLSVVHMGSPPGDWLRDAYALTQLPNGGSVACTGMGMLHLLGCDPIVLIGMDSAFTDLQGHASRSDQGEAMRYVYREADRALECHVAGFDHPVRVYTVDPVAAWGGKGQVLTYDGFSIYRSWFEGAAASWAADRRLINATEGGARYDGFEELPLCDVLDTFRVKGRDLEAELDRIIADAPPPDPAPFDAIIRAEQATVADVARLSKRAAVTAKRAQALIAKGKLKAARTPLLELEKLETEVRTKSRTSRLLNQYLGPKATTFRRGRHQDKTDDPVAQTRNALKRSAALFSMLGEGARELLAMFDGVAENASTAGKR